MAAKVAKPPLVECVWTDACDVDGSCRWEPGSKEVSERFHLKRRQTVGFLVYKDEATTILAHDFDPADASDEDTRPSVGNFTLIPTGWVVRLHYIRGGPRVRRNTSSIIASTQAVIARYNEHDDDTKAN